MKTSADLIESVFIDNHKPLLRLLNRRLKNSHMAEDLMQDVFLRLLQQDSTLEITNVRSYLYRIASNLAIDLERRTAASSWGYLEPLEDDLVCSNPLPDAVTETLEELEQLERFISELPPQCRRIFLYSRVQQLSHMEIAEQLGISPRTVETQVRKAMLVLRKRMQVWLVS